MPGHKKGANSSRMKLVKASGRVPKYPIPAGAFLVQVKEIVTRTYRVPASDEADARARFARGEYHRFYDNDVEVDEILSVERET